MGAITDFTIINGDQILQEEKSQRTIHKIKTVVLETAATVDAADTIEFDLATVGGETLLGQHGYAHSTDNSVIVPEVTTSVVVGTVVTITIPAGTDNDKRVVVLFFI